MKRPGHSLALLAAILSFSTTNPARADIPYALSAGGDSLLLGTGVASGLTTLWLGGKVSPLTEQELSSLDRNSISSLDRSAAFNWSTGSAALSDRLLAATALTPLVATLASGLPAGEVGTLTAIYAETLLFSWSLTGWTKALIRRPRPFTYNPDAPTENKMEADAVKSFFSGHTSTAFASAVFLSTVFESTHPDSPARPWVWAGSLAAATTVGYLRWSAGKHFPSDILTGALIGGSIGWLIPWMHRTDRTSSAQLTAGPGLFQVRFPFPAF